ncbi:prepilin peptidase [uncultured Maricaulis sp.]|uniref:A24 family peptidase n=1 Tax=uncultured Maricaulis sp. TaxID=174710 RepID=UPI0030DC8EE6|tara:strand:+ start:240011 stop:240508 length:498 start_codon:yes stop_codon:yes gene_type:complete
MLLQITSLALIGLVLFAGFCDATRFTIPNWPAIAIIALFPIAALLAGLGWAELGNHLLAGVLALVFAMALFAPGWIGGGDGKLFAAVALWFGWPGVIVLLAHTALVGGALVLLLLLLRFSLPALGVSPEKLAGTALATGAPVPYGIAIAGGVIWSLPATVFAVTF